MQSTNSGGYLVQVCIHACVYVCVRQKNKYCLSWPFKLYSVLSVILVCIFSYVLKNVVFVLQVPADY